jgi:hypothetical protein
MFKEDRNKTPFGTQNRKTPTGMKQFIQSNGKRQQQFLCSGMWKIEEKTSNRLRKKYRP